MQAHFREQLIDLWNGKLFQQREVVNYALDGSEVHVLMQFSVLPGHEKDWSLVQVALTDITARKKAEVYLEFLGKHDVLTKLYNRSFYVDELNRIERKGLRPVTVVMADLNGLKAANDQWGHGAGDALLRRVGEVLGKAVERPACAARIGGDEFAILLPGIDEAGGEAIDAGHQPAGRSQQPVLFGRPSQPVDGGRDRAGSGERLEDVVKRADMTMYRGQARLLFGLQARPPPDRRLRRGDGAELTIAALKRRQSDCRRRGYGQLADRLAHRRIETFAACTEIGDDLAPASADPRTCADDRRSRRPRWRDPR